MANYPPSYIEDGYTETAYLAPVEHLHSGCEFDFRPVSWEERTRVLTGFDALPADEKIRRIESTVLKKVIAWRFPRTPHVPVNKITVKCIAPNVIDRIFNIVMRVGDPDERPGGDENVTPQPLFDDEVTPATAEADSLKN